MKLSTSADNADHSEIADRRVFVALLGLLVYAPLPLASNRTWAIAILVLGVTLIFCWGMFHWLRQWDWLCKRLATFALPIGLFFVFVLISVLQILPLPDALVASFSPEAYQVQSLAGLQGAMHLSLDVYQSRIMLALTCSYFMVFMMCILIVRDSERINTLATTLVWSGLFQAMLGIILFSFGAHYRIFFNEILHENVIGTFVNRNHFAGYMEMTLALGIGLMIAKLGNHRASNPGWKLKIVAALNFMMSSKMRFRLMLVVMVIALVLTRSRMGNTAFFSAMLVVGILTVLISRKNAPATAALILSLVIVDVFVIGTWVGLEKVVSRIHETQLVASDVHTEETIEERTLPAKYSLNLIRDFPLFGTGGGSYYDAFIRYRSSEMTAFFDHAHNDYAEITADMGLIATASMLLLSLSCLFVAIKTIYTRRSSMARGVAFGSAMGIVAIAIHSWVDFNLQIPANALTFVVVISLSWLAYKLPSRA